MPSIVLRDENEGECRQVLGGRKDTWPRLVHRRSPRISLLRVELGDKAMVEKSTNLTVHRACPLLHALVFFYMFIQTCRPHPHRRPPHHTTSPPTTLLMYVTHEFVLRARYFPPGRRYCWLNRTAPNTPLRHTCPLQALNATKFANFAVKLRFAAAVGIYQGSCHTPAVTRQGTAP